MSPYTHELIPRKFFNSPEHPGSGQIWIRFPWLLDNDPEMGRSDLDEKYGRTVILWFDKYGEMVIPKEFLQEISETTKFRCTMADLAYGVMRNRPGMVVEIIYDEDCDAGTLKLWCGKNWQDIYVS